MKNPGQVAHLGDGDWEAEVMGSEIPVFLDFSATWCGPCHAMAPVVQELAAEYSGRVKFLEVDVDKNPEVTSRFEVFSVPTFAVVVRGKTEQRFVGMATKGYMAKLLEASIGGRLP